MDHPQIPEERDELRARFTAWLDTTVYHAKLKYLRKEAHRIKTISLEDVPEEFILAQDPALSSFSEPNAFDFEEERLANAFMNLSVKRQQILTMLFVEQKKPEEISHLLNCSVQHVYDQRYQALKKLRKMLNEGV